MTPTLLRHTTGRVEATINEQPSLSFLAETDLKVTIVGAKYKVAARMPLENNRERYIDLSFPSDLAGDGREYSFPLTPSSEAQGRYSRFPENESLASNEGSLQVHFDTTQRRLWGTFDYRVGSGDLRFEISKGNFDLFGFDTAKPGGTGTFTGTVDKQTFDASEVGIRRVDDIGLPEPYLEVIGRTRPAVGAEHIAIQIDTDVNGLRHTLGRDDSQVRALYFHSLSGFFLATSGEVSFDALPTPTQVKGTIVKGIFQQNTEQLREIDCTFDITENPTGNG